MIQSLPSFLPKMAVQSLFFAATIAATLVFAGSGAAGATFAAGDGEVEAGPRNVFGQELGVCSTEPMTGYFRWVQG